MPKGMKYMFITNTKQFQCQCGYTSRKYTNQRGYELAKKLHEKKCVVGEGVETRETIVTTDIRKCETKEGHKI